MFGTRRALVLDDLGTSYRIDQYEPVAQSSLEAGIDHALASSRLLEQKLTTMLEDPLTAEVAHFVAGILDKAAVRSDTLDGYECVRLLAAGAESIESGGALVPLR